MSSTSPPLSLSNNSFSPLLFVTFSYHYFSLISLSLYIYHSLHLTFSPFFSSL